MDYNILNNYLLVGAIVFSLGLVGFLTRRNLIVMFLCAEMMLQGVSLTLVAFSKFLGTWAGLVFALFSLALAGAEAAIAMALIVMLFRRGHSLDVSLWQDIREPDQPPVPDEFGPETERRSSTPSGQPLRKPGTSRRRRRAASTFIPNILKWGAKGPWIKPATSTPILLRQRMLSFLGLIVTLIPLSPLLAGNFHSRFWAAVSS